MLRIWCDERDDLWLPAGQKSVLGQSLYFPCFFFPRAVPRVGFASLIQPLNKEFHGRNSPCLWEVSLLVFP